MKRIALMIISFTFLVGCQKNKESLSNQSETIILQKSTSARQLLLSFPEEEQRSVFNSFSAAEMANVWIEKLDQVIEYGGWSNNQLDLLTQLKDELNAEVYSDSIAFNLMMSTFGIEWELEAVEEFGSSDFILIFMQPHDYSDKSVYMYGPGGGEPAPDCDCNSRVVVNACGFPTGSDDTCASKPCGKSAHGCGWVFIQSCNSKCSQFGA